MDAWLEVLNWRRNGTKDKEQARSIGFDLGLIISGGLSRADWHQEANRHEKAFHGWLAWFTAPDLQSLPEGPRQDARKFDDLVKSATIERHMFRTENGRMGFGPESAGVGDVVVVMPGGRVPYVLRPMLDMEESFGCEQGAFSLLGDAFVHGAMLGEAVAGSDLAHQGWQDISLV